MPIPLKLNQIAPLDDLRHVKRVRKQRCEGGKNQLSVILCLACEEKQECMPSKVMELIKLYQLTTFVTKVCKFAALSKEEWEEQCKLWPTSYHPPTYNIDGITGFSEEGSHFVLYSMKLALRMAKFCKRQVVNAAVIADPSTKQVIAKACDQTFSEVISHSKGGVETCCHGPVEAFSPQTSFYEVDNLASSNSNSLSDETMQLHTAVSCLYPWKWAQSSNHLGHPLRHAAMVAIEYSAARDRRLFPGIRACEGNLTRTEKLESSTGSPVKRQKISANVNNLEEPGNQAEGVPVRPYLCTGYDIFLVWEPCTMCAMALVHQRIRRIFYAFPNPNNGALGSVHRLQGEKSLNHHYAVFRVLLPEKFIEDSSITPAAVKERISF